MSKNSKTLLHFAHRLDVNIDRLNGVIPDDDSILTKDLMRIRNDLKAIWQLLLTSASLSRKD